MNITMKLDTNAVRDLIKSDADFELELQRSVIATVVRGMFANDLKTEIAKEITSQVKAQYPALVAAIHETENMQLLIDQQIKAMVVSMKSNAGVYVNSRTLSPEAAALVNAAVSQLITDKAKECFVALEHRVEKRMENLTQEMEGKLDKLVANIDRTWRVEAMKEIRADIIARMSGAIPEV